MLGNKIAWVIALLPLATAVYTGCASSTGTDYTGDDAATDGLAPGQDSSTTGSDSAPTDDGPTSNGG